MHKLLVSGFIPKNLKFTLNQNNSIILMKSEVIIMRMVDIIVNKREGLANTQKEIEFAIDGYVNGSIPDYQISAWLMAIFFKGMTDEESF